ncbi:MAG: bifunctional diaminohydroxyphosphoribosylaminopyrimidine deaminase/5-amino-6-(5-phosphoribosylamino)uracil reductase RibD [Verrucomicrobiae bacterium]|nr:bifunctional diaminohydroxyphosphoribosylaminopyrimidine deaminase/5-amino-6-(5-phosphoribosylamino)uracil reductase RibD [Verrucomicrobiae bacterium]
MASRSSSAPPKSSTHDDRTWMKIALHEGAKGLGLTSPNPPVGAVLVKDDHILGRGWHRKAGEAHAEVVAIEDALGRCSPDDLKKATLYVTLEPCSTTGRTGACTDLIQLHQIGRVVIGTVDPNPAHAGAGIKILEKAGVEVITGCREDEAKHLIRFFAKHITTGRPWVIAKTAITLDGRTTLRSEDGSWITGKAALDDVQKLRRQIDAILIGGETLRRDDPRLTLRGDFAKDRPQPWRVVLTAMKDLPTDAKLFTDEHHERTMILRGASLEKSLDLLGDQGVCSVMIESGGRLMAHGLANDLIDEVVIYLAPILGGGDTRLMPVDRIVADLCDVTYQQIGRDFRVTGFPKRRP